MKELQLAWLVTSLALLMAIVCAITARYYYHSARKAWQWYDTLNAAYTKLQKQQVPWHTTVDAEEILPSKY
jgi:hypothetical protein